MDFYAIWDAVLESKLQMSFGKKCKKCILQQCDGLPVMNLGWLTVVGKVMGSPSWSPGMDPYVGYEGGGDDRHPDDDLTVML